MRRDLGPNSPEARLFSDYWNLIQKYYDPEDTDEYWSELLTDFSAFCERWKTEYAKDLALAFVNTQERRYKKRKGGSI